MIAAGSSTPHNPQTGRFDPQFVAIRDGRPLLGELSLDKQGFELIRHETWVNDFYDRQEVERVYYREVESLLKKLRRLKGRDLRGALPSTRRARRKGRPGVCKDGP